jgi:hypothetical protein
MFFKPLHAGDVRQYVVNKKKKKYLAKKEVRIGSVRLIKKKYKLGLDEVKLL